MLPHVETLYDQIDRNLKGYREFLKNYEASNPTAYRDSEAIAKAVADLDECLKDLRRVNPDFMSVAGRSCDISLAMAARFAMKVRPE